MDTLKQHRLKSIDELYMFSRTGVVQGSTNWSDTHVSGSGGGGSGVVVGGYGSSSSAPVHISSTVTQRQRFFICDADGDETEIRDADLGVRDGQVVTAVYCGKKNAVNSLGWTMGFGNQNTGATSYMNARLATLTGAPSRQQGAWVIVFGLVCFMLSMAFIPFALILFPAAGAVGYFWWKASSRSKALTAQIKDRINQEIALRKSEAKALRPAAAPSMTSAAADA